MKIKNKTKRRERMARWKSYDEFVATKRENELVHEGLECMKVCEDLDTSCPNSSCRHHMEFEDELNCSLISIKRNDKMTLREVGDRLGISFVRVKQIEGQTVEKLIKRLAKAEITPKIFHQPDDYL